jgi:hypothetical protein
MRLEPWISDRAAHRTRLHPRSKPEVSHGGAPQTVRRSLTVLGVKIPPECQRRTLQLRPDLGAIGEENVDAQAQRGVVLNVFAVLLAIAVVQLGVRWKVADR